MITKLLSVHVASTSQELTGKLSVIILLNYKS